jgi:hypothetical protein
MKWQTLRPADALLSDKSCMLRSYAAGVFCFGTAARAASHAMERGGGVAPRAAAMDG